MSAEQVPTGVDQDMNGMLTFVDTRRIDCSSTQQLPQPSLPSGPSSTSSPSVAGVLSAWGGTDSSASSSLIRHRTNYSSTCAMFDPQQASFENSTMSESASLLTAQLSSTASPFPPSVASTAGMAMPTHNVGVWPQPHSNSSASSSLGTIIVPTQFSTTTAELSSSNTAQHSAFSLCCYPGGGEHAEVEHDGTCFSLGTTPTAARLQYFPTAAQTSKPEDGVSATTVLVRQHSGRGAMPSPQNLTAVPKQSPKPQTSSISPHAPDDNTSKEQEDMFDRSCEVERGHTLQHRPLHQHHHQFGLGFNPLFANSVEADFDTAPSGPVSQLGSASLSPQSDRAPSISLKIGSRRMPCGHGATVKDGDGDDDGDDDELNAQQPSSMSEVPVEEF